MAMLIVLGYILFVLGLLAGILAALVGLPGTVLVLLDGVLLSAASHWHRPGAWVLLVLALLALAAETMDSLCSAMSTRYHGGSTRTGLVAMLGGVTGAFLGSWAGATIGAAGIIGGPLSFMVTVVLVPLFLALVAGYYAAYWYEIRQGKPPDEAHLAGKGALIGRLLGVMGKSLVAVIMSAVLLWVAFVH